MSTKNLIYSLCIIFFAMISCTKIDLTLGQDSANSIDNSNEKIVTLTATIGSEDTETKVKVDGSKTEWEIGDVIYVGKFTSSTGTDIADFPSDNIVATLVVTEDNISEDMKTVYFDFEIDESGGVYLAIYKYDYFNSDYRNDTEYTQEYLDNYDYVGQNIWMTTDLLYIYEDIDDYSLIFNHHSTIFDLNFELSSEISETYSVKSVILEMPYEIYYYTASSVKITRPEYFKLNLAVGTTLSPTSSFRAVIPAYVRSSVSLSDDDVMRIHVTYSDGSYSIIEKSPKTYYPGVRYSADILIDQVTISSSYLLLENMRAGELSTIFPSSVDGFSVSDIKITGAIEDSDIKNLITEFPYAKNLDLSEAAFFNNILPSETFYYEKFPSKGANLIGDLSYVPDHGYSMADFETIILPSTLTEIGSYAFMGLYKLKEIVIPESVTTLGTGILSCCQDLKKVTLPSNIETLPPEMFAYSGLEEFTISDNVSSLGYAIFYKCLSLESVTLSNNIPTLSLYTFAYTPIKSISIPSSIKSVLAAFYGCTELESVIFESDPNVSTLELSISGSFENCTSLKSITLPERLSSIGSKTFSYTGISTIYIPSNVVTCDYAFANAQYLSSVNFANDSKLETISGSFYGCVALKSIEIPNTVTDFGYETFVSCPSLEEITFAEGSILETMTGYKYSGVYYSPFINTLKLKKIELPNSITSLGIGLFAESSLEEITLGSNLSNIGLGVFYNCKDLSLIKCYSEVPPTFSLSSNSTDAFDGSNSYMKLQVPTNYLDAYKSDDIWSFNFALGASIIGGL
ncbi:MAG: leucine-rich repeat protein [Rikenellaceae bacterium]